MIKRINLFMDRIFVNITNWIICHKYSLVRFIVLTILVVALSFLPYLNLIFTSKLVAFLIFALFFVIFKINWKFILYLCIVLFVLALILTVSRFTSASMMIGDYIYGFLIIIAVQYFIQI